MIRGDTECHYYCALPSCCVGCVTSSLGDSRPLGGLESDELGAVGESSGLEVSGLEGSGMEVSGGS